MCLSSEEKKDCIETCRGVAFGSLIIYLETLISQSEYYKWRAEKAWFRQTEKRHVREHQRWATKAKLCKDEIYRRIDKLCIIINNSGKAVAKQFEPVRITRF